MIEVAKIDGKKIANAEVFVSAKGQSQTIHLPATITPGYYVVRVITADKITFSEKVLVE